MNDIKYDKDIFSFAYRVSALIYNKDKTKILLFYGENSNFYMLPGGKVHELEKSEDAIKREINEELEFKNLQFELRGISEEIVKQDGKNIHQITITYGSIYENEIIKEKFKSIESDWISFEWIDIKKLGNLKIHPSNISKMVNNKFTHLVEEIIK